MKRHCESNMKSVLELSEVKAYKYFMESSNFCSLDLPKYIDFSKVLAYIEKKVGKKSFVDILKDKDISYYKEIKPQELIDKRGEFSGEFSRAMDFGAQSPEEVIVFILVSDGDKSKLLRTLLLGRMFYVLSKLRSETAG